MWSSRWFIFVFFFTIDVRVRASNEFHERPAGCLKNKTVCALQTKNDSFHLVNLQTEFHLGPKTLVLRNSPEQIEFINGTFWAQKFNKMTVKTLFGEVISESGPFWVLGDQQKIWVRNVNADLKIQLRDGHSLELPQGFQIWISGMDDKGHSTTGIPEMIPVEDHIRLWSFLYQGNRQDFLSEVRDIKWTWGSLPERSSQLYLSIIQRQEHLAQLRHDAIQKRKLAQQDENKRVKEMFIERAFWR
jgi:hypothetical protein